MKIILALLVLLGASTIPSLGQSTRQEIEGLKKQLETLQRQLLTFDPDSIASGKRVEIERLQASSETKGEFETTKQFEKRKVDQQAQIDALGKEVEEVVAISRCLLQEKINNAIATQFTLTIVGSELSVGTYDADSQRFPVFYYGTLQGFIPVPLTEAKSLKDSFAIAKKTAVVGVSLDSQNRTNEYLLSVSLVVASKTYGAAFTPQFLMAKAMEIIYGNFDPEKQISTWSFPSKELLEARDSAVITSTPGMLTPIKWAGIDAMLFYAKERDEDSMGCHACGRVFSYGIFVKSGTIWKPQVLVRNAGEYGSWGMLDQPKVVQVGPEKYAFVLASGSAAMFYDSYFEINNGCLSHMLTVELGGDDGGNLKVNVKFLPSSKSYFDAVVTTSGKKYVDVGNRSVLKPISKTDLYQHLGSGYRLVVK